jgi:hypothetical protein
MHVHREYNTVVDKLSKKALNNPLGFLFYEEILQENVVNVGNFLLF